MTIAEKFKEVFQLYATEVWAMPEREFMCWLNEKYPETATETTEYAKRYLSGRTRLVVLDETSLMTEGQWDWLCDRIAAIAQVPADILKGPLSLVKEDKRE